MFGLSQKITLERVQILLVAAFRLEHCSLSKNRVISKKLNHQFKCREQKKIFQAVLDITFLSFSTFQKSLHSLCVKWFLVATIKNTVFELPHELSNCLRLRKLRNIKVIKIWNFVGDCFGQNTLLLPKIGLLPETGIIISRAESKKLKKLRKSLT